MLGKATWNRRTRQAAVTMAAHGASPAETLERIIREPDAPKRPRIPAPPAPGEAGAVALQDEIIREPECHRVTGLSRSTRWRLERAGLFPRRRRISPGCTGWLRSEILGWVASR